MPYTLDEVKLKKLLKTAVEEVLEERRDLVSEALADAVEDLGMVRAIVEGARSEQVSRDEVFRILRKRR
jgi:F0F1-type ATP synthase membrane subunit b/b'